jgi:alpha-ketoglutarate-dependent taurine dioxygenase
MCPFCYRHEQADDLIVSDNRCVLHRATPFDTTHHQRLMQRTTVSGDPDELAPSGVAVADGRLS